MKVRNQIFISYSHKDKRWQEMLCTKGALERYRADLAIAQELASQGPNNAAWQGDLAIAYLCVGEEWSRVEADSKLKAGAWRDLEV